MTRQSLPSGSAGPGVPRQALAVLAVVVALLAGSCARLPTSGPVVAGGPANPNRALQAIVPGPAVGASPSEIINGFLQATLSTEDGYAVARSYLAPEAGVAWQPTNEAVIYTGSPEVTGTTNGNSGTGQGETSERRSDDATVTIRQTAVIDADGRLTRSAETKREIALELTRIDGEWRISEVPDLTLVSDSDLDFVFSRYPVYFLDPTGTYLVGDPRWLPDSELSASRLVSLVLAGPPQWLSPAVTTAFGKDVQLASAGAVQLNAGVADIELSQQARRAAPATRGLMRAQLLATLQPLFAVEDVQLRADSTVLDVPDISLPVEPQVAADPFLLVDDEVTMLAGGQRESLTRNPTLAELNPRSMAVSLDQPGRQRFAVVSGGGRSLYVAPIRGAGGEVVLDGTNLTRPSFDWRGWVWSTEAMTDGTISVVAADGKPSRVTAPWLAGRRIDALRVARSGTVVAIASSDAGGSALQLASITRDDNGRPTALTLAEGDPIGFGVTAVTDLTWVGPDEVVVLGRRDGGSGARVFPVIVGGPGQDELPQLAGARQVTAGTGVSSVLVTTDDKALLSLTGQAWVEVPGADKVVDATFPG